MFVNMSLNKRFNGLVVHLKFLVFLLPEGLFFTLKAPFYRILHYFLFLVFYKLPLHPIPNAQSSIPVNHCSSQFTDSFKSATGNNLGFHI